MKVQAVFPYLCVHDSAAAIDFYAKAFGAWEIYRLAEPGGRIGHAELDFGGTTLMLADPFPEYDIRSAADLGGTPVTIHLHVEDADTVVHQALQAGAMLERPVTNAFHGERSGVVRCPFGHRWLIGHAIEDVSLEEMQRRYASLFDAT